MILYIWLRMQTWYNWVNTQLGQHTTGSAMEESLLLRYNRAFFFKFFFRNLFLQREHWTTWAAFSIAPIVSSDGMWECDTECDCDAPMQGTQQTRQGLHPTKYLYSWESLLPRWPRQPLECIRSIRTGTANKLCLIPMLSEDISGRYLSWMTKLAARHHMVYGSSMW